MRLKTSDLELLKEIHAFLYESNARKLSVPLAGMITRVEEQRTVEQRKNKERALKNRERGYIWRSSYHPKNSKYTKGGDDRD